MAKSGLHLFNLVGFEVRLDWSWFILAILITWSLAAGYFPVSSPNLSTQTYYIMGIVGALGLFLSIILHELCHSLVGRYYGMPISGITLFIFGGVAELNENPTSPKVEFLMALAGPLFSILFGILFSVLYHIGIVAKWSPAAIGVLTYLSIINIFVGIFNLLPGFPLDGGRVLRSILWWWKGDLMWATRIACRSGAALGFTLAILGVVLFFLGQLISGAWIFLLGFFIQHISKLSYNDILISELFHDDPIKKYVKTNPVIIPLNITLQNFVDNYLYQYFHQLYPILDGDELVGYISFDDLKHVPKSEWNEMQVKQIMSKCTPDIVIDAQTKVKDVIRRMLSQRQKRFIVTDQGKLFGIITLNDILDIAQIKLKFI